MTCSTNTYFLSLGQSLKEYIDYGLIKELMQVSLVFIYFMRMRPNHSSSQIITQLLIFKIITRSFCHTLVIGTNLTIKKFS